MFIFFSREFSIANAKSKGSGTLLRNSEVKINVTQATAIIVNIPVDQAFWLLTPTHPPLDPNFDPFQHLK